MFRSTTSTEPDTEEEVSSVSRDHSDADHSELSEGEPDWEARQRRRLQQLKSGASGQRTRRESPPRTRRESPPDSGRSSPTRRWDDRQFATIYTEWANHYLEKANYTRFITDLQRDISDGVLLADVIAAVTNEKVQDIRSKPKSPAQMLDNINACICLLDNLGINTEGLSAQDIREGSLKSILGLFYSLSRYKQQLKNQLNGGLGGSGNPASSPSGQSTSTTTSGNNNDSLSSNSSRPVSSKSCPAGSGIPSLVNRRNSDIGFGEHKINGGLHDNNNPPVGSSSRPHSTKSSTTVSHCSSRSTSPSSSVSGSSGIPLPTTRLASRSAERARQLSAHASSAGSLTSSTSASTTATRSTFSAKSSAAPASSLSKLSCPASPVVSVTSPTPDPVLPDSANNNDGQGSMLDKLKFFKSDKSGKNGGSAAPPCPAPDPRSSSSASSSRRSSGPKPTRTGALPVPTVDGVPVTFPYAAPHMAYYSVPATSGVPGGIPTVSSAGVPAGAALGAAVQAGVPTSAAHGSGAPQGAQMYPQEVPDRRHHHHVSRADSRTLLQQQQFSSIPRHSSRSSSSSAHHRASSSSRTHLPLHPQQFAPPPAAAQTAIPKPGTPQHHGSMSRKSSRSDVRPDVPRSITVANPAYQHHHRGQAGGKASTMIPSPSSQYPEVPAARSASKSSLVPQDTSQPPPLPPQRSSASKPHHHHVIPPPTSQMHDPKSRVMSSVPYPRGISAPASSSPVPPPEGATVISNEHSGRKSASTQHKASVGTQSSKHDRQKAKELFNALKQSDRSRSSGGKSSHKSSGDPALLQQQQQLLQHQLLQQQQQQQQEQQQQQQDPQTQSASQRHHAQMQQFLQRQHQLQQMQQQQLQQQQQLHQLQQQQQLQQLQQHQQQQQQQMQQQIQQQQQQQQKEQLHQQQQQQQQKEQQQKEQLHQQQQQQLQQQQQQQQQKELLHQQQQQQLQQQQLQQQQLQQQQQKQQKQRQQQKEQSTDSATQSPKPPPRHQSQQQTRHHQQPQQQQQQPKAAEESSAEDAPHIDSMQNSAPGPTSNDNNVPFPTSMQKMSKSVDESVSGGLMGVKSMQPLAGRGSTPYSYLKLLSSASKAYTQVASQSSRLNVNRLLYDPTKLAAGKRAPSQGAVVEAYLSDAESFDASGYLSDGDMLKNSGYASDNSGYMSEGGIHMYAKRMQQTFREGMQAVKESLQKTKAIDSDQSLDEDSGSVSSGDISDAVADLAADDSLQTSAPAPPPHLRHTGRANSVGSSSYVAHQAPGVHLPYRAAPVSYASDAECQSSDLSHYGTLRKYSSDVEADYDRDYTSDGSLDRRLVRGFRGDPCFSDTETASREMIAAAMAAGGKVEPAGGRKSSLTSLVSQSGPAAARRGLMPSGASSGAQPFQRNVYSRASLGNRHYPAAAGAVRHPGRPAPAADKDKIYGVANSPQLCIRSGAGQAPALEDLSRAHNRSMSMPGQRLQLPSPQREQNPISPASSLCNVKLPYATGVKSSTSSTSLARGDIHDDLFDAKGSSLSLASASSCVSTEDKQAHEIRKLRRELENAQDKVSTLTTQLCTNAHVVSAFEQSLTSMTTRLHALTATAEAKDTELIDLKNTIDSLRRQTGLFGRTQPPTTERCPLRRMSSSGGRELQPSESLTSLHSNSSVTSSDVKKGKHKKSWLKNPLGKAFKRKSKGGSISDVEGDTFVSVPGSPLMSPGLKESKSSGTIHSDTEEVQTLRRQLDERDLRLTDIQLDALTSAHHLEQLRDLMGRMKTEMSVLKLDNERLHRMVQRHHTVAQNPSQEPRPTHQRQSSRGSPDSGSLTKRLSLDPTQPSFDLIFGFTVEEGGQRLTVCVAQAPQSDSRAAPHLSSSSCPSEIKDIDIGCVGLSPNTKWESLDNCVRRIFKEYVSKVDPMANLGLNGDSICAYQVGETFRYREQPPPDSNPTESLGEEMAEGRLRIQLRSVLQSGSVDALAFETLIPKTILQRYVSLLVEHRRIILCGPSGTGKTYLADKLAEYLVKRSGRQGPASNAITTFNVDHKSSKELRTYLSSIAEQAEQQAGPGAQPQAELPSVIILDNLHHISSLAEIFNNFLSVKHQRCPYIIGTMNQATCSNANLQLHHNFRWVLCANHMEPVKGFLGRYLRRKLIHAEVAQRAHNRELEKLVEWIPLVWQHLNKFLETHSSSDVTIGPRLFLSCPMSVEGSQVWFTDLWNYSLVPYLLEAVREGLSLYGRRAAWEDPVDWITDTWPWSTGPGQQDWSALMHLRPEDVGFDSTQPPPSTPQLSGSGPNGGSNAAKRAAGGSGSESSGNAGAGQGQGSAAGAGAASGMSGSGGDQNDPLMTMLMRLQEAANYSSPHSNDSDSSSHDTSLSSAAANKESSI